MRKILRKMRWRLNMMSRVGNFLLVAWLCDVKNECFFYRKLKIWIEDLVRFSEIQGNSVIFSGIQRKWTQNRAQNEIIREIVEISETFFFCFEEMCYLFVSWLLIRELFPPCIHRVSKVKLWYVLLVSLLYTLTLVTNRSFFAWCTMNTHFKGRWKKSVKKKKTKREEPTSHSHTSFYISADLMYISVKYTNLCEYRWNQVWYMFCWFWDRFVT